MKILLTGKNGQLGFELQRALAPLGEVVAVGTQDCDLADADALRELVRRVAPDVIVNPAAYTAVDKAESDEATARAVNAVAPAILGEEGAKLGALVLHYSTDYVFDGTAKKPYREDDPTAPLGVYGRSKLAGEHALRASGAQHLILRTAWVYAARGNNFLRTMLRVGAERDEVRVVDDQIGAPTSARRIADATASALEQWLGADATERAGTYHLTSAGRASWFDFATGIFEHAVARGLIARVPRVQPIATAEYPTRARRPAYSVLDCSRFENAFGIQLPDWRVGLESVLDELAT